MVKSCQSQGAEMITMDINLNITDIDDILNNTDHIWIRGTRLRWVWNYGKLLTRYQAYNQCFDLHVTAIKISLFGTGISFYVYHFI